LLYSAGLIRRLSSRLSPLATRRNSCLIRVLGYGFYIPGSDFLTSPTRTLSSVKSASRQSIKGDMASGCDGFWVGMGMDGQLRLST